MSRIAYVNGQYVPHSQACVHIEDRGYQFADGVYEVCELRGGFIVDESLHLARLERSLSELKIAMPMKLESLKTGDRISDKEKPNQDRNNIFTSYTWCCTKGPWISSRKILNQLW